MKIDTLASFLQGQLRSLGHSLFLPGKDGFAENLNLGQVIKGKVLRHYEGGRYLVDFSGQEKVVDSAVPLRTNEVLYGRVVALGDKVELQRVAAEQNRTTVGKQISDALGQTAERALVGKHEQAVNQVFDKYQGKLTLEQKAALVKMVKTVPTPGKMALAGLVLSKLGLSQAPELLRAVYNAMQSKAQRTGSFPSLGNIPQLQSAPGSVETQVDTALQPLANAVAALMENLPEKKIAQRKLASQPELTGTGESQDQEASAPPRPQQRYDQDWYHSGFYHLGRWVLNSQIEGSVAHRLGTLPLWLGHQLVEVDLAVFDQKQGTTTLNDGLRHRQLVFSLHLEQLGHVEVMVKVADRHLRVQIMTDNAAATEVITGYMGPLRGMLQQAGWSIDELVYGTNATDSDEQVVGAVIEHIISQDSLSRLM